MNPDLFFSKVMVEAPRCTTGSMRYVVHQLIAELFGQFEHRPYLFRVVNQDGDRAEVLVLSTLRPNAELLPKRAEGSVLSVETKSFPRLRTGQTLEFEIEVNATVAESATRRRFDVLHWAREKAQGPVQNENEPYEVFLSRQLEGCATLHRAHIVDRQNIEVRTPAPDRHMKGKFVKTTLQGLITIDDAEAFMAKLGTGVGRGKAYGMGLLCLRRAA